MIRDIDEMRFRVINNRVGAHPGRNLSQQTIGFEIDHPGHIFAAVAGSRRGVTHYQAGNPSESSGGTPALGSTGGTQFFNLMGGAPIFEYSDLGIVGDLNKILPKLTEAVKAKKG